MKPQPLPKHISALIRELEDLVAEVMLKLDALKELGIVITNDPLAAKSSHPPTSPDATAKVIPMKQH